MKNRLGLLSNEMRVMIVMAIAISIADWFAWCTYRNAFLTREAIYYIPYALLMPFVIVASVAILMRALGTLKAFKGLEDLQRSTKALRIVILLALSFMMIEPARILFAFVFTRTFPVRGALYLHIPESAEGTLSLLIIGIILAGTFASYDSKKLMMGFLMSIFLIISTSMMNFNIGSVLDSAWIKSVNAVRPRIKEGEWRDNRIVIVSIPNSTQTDELRSIVRLIERSNPRVVGYLFPLESKLVRQDTAIFAAIDKQHSLIASNLVRIGDGSPYRTRPLFRDRRLMNSVLEDLPYGWRPNYARKSVIGLPVQISIGTGSLSLGKLHDWVFCYYPVFSPSSGQRGMVTDFGVAAAEMYLSRNLNTPTEETTATRQDHSVNVWQDELPLDSDGKAMVNFGTSPPRSDSRWWWGDRDFFPSYSHPRDLFPYCLFALNDSVSDLTGKVERRMLARECYIPTVHNRYTKYYLVGDSLHLCAEEILAGREGEQRRRGTIPFLEDKLVIVSAHDADAPWAMEMDYEGLTYASIIKNILDKSYIYPAHGVWQFVFLVLIACASFFAYNRFKAVTSLLVSALVLFALLMASALMYTYGSVFVSITPAMLFFILASATIFPVELRRERVALLQERTRALAELRTAHETQMALMPSEDPTIPGFDISGQCRPADEVGGDYFDYVWLDNENTRLGIAVADVSGKAMKAAITAVMTSGMVYREAGANETPKTILRKINRPMYFKTDKRIFTAMSFAVIDIRTKRMTFSNAGQMQPLLKRTGQIQTLRVEGARLPLGMTEDVEYNEMTINLESGDIVLFYTDGIPEAMNGKDEMFGFDRLEAVVRENPAHLTARQISGTIMEKVAEFAGSASQHDDMTVVVVRIV